MCRATFRSKLIPNAVRWYTGEANEDDEDEDYDEEDEVGDDNEDEDGEDEVSGVRGVHEELAAALPDAALVTARNRCICLRLCRRHI